MADTAESRQEFDGKYQPDYLDMVKFYRESFNTVLTPEQEWRFHDWADQHKAKDILDALDDYDVRGAFLDGCELKGSPAKWPPKYAKPNFPMFSSESIYHGTADQHAGGTYKGGTLGAAENNKQTFMPSAKMLETTHPMQWLGSWMRTNAPKVILLDPGKVTDQQPTDRTDQ